MAMVTIPATTQDATTMTGKSGDVPQRMRVTRVKQEAFGLEEWKQRASAIPRQS